MQTIIKQKLVDYEVYRSIDGKEFEYKSECEDHELRLSGLRKECPNCHGQGKFRGRFVPEYDNYDIGHVDAHYEYETCKTCNGKGYLDKKVSWE